MKKRFTGVPTVYPECQPKPDINKLTEEVTEFDCLTKHTGDKGSIVVVRYDGHFTALLVTAVDASRCKNADLLEFRSVDEAKLFAEKLLTIVQKI